MQTAADWIEQNAGYHDRFLLFIDEFDPHEPFDTPEPWANRYDPDWQDRHPRRAALMTAAGPAANLILALIAFGAMKAGLAAGLWIPSTGDYYELDRLVERTADSSPLRRSG